MNTIPLNLVADDECPRCTASELCARLGEVEPALRCVADDRLGWEAASPLAGVLESKPALPSREEDTDAAFAATACCNAIPGTLACCLSKW
jgi:hypothetical protein